METHVRLLAILQIVLNLLGLLFAAAVLIIMTGVSVVTYHPTGFHGGPPTTWLAIVGCAVSCFLILLSAPGFLAGVGLLRYRPWARALSIILHIMGLFSIPFGTILGIYGLWVLLHRETTELFEENSV